MDQQTGAPRSPRLRPQHKSTHVRLQEAPACLPGKPQQDEIINIVPTALLRFHGDQLVLHSR